MTVKGIDQWVVRKDYVEMSSSVEDFPKEFSELSKSKTVKLHTTEMKQDFQRKNIYKNVYLRHFMPCNIVRLVLSIFLLCILIILVSQSKSIIITMKQFTTVYISNDENDEGVRYSISEDSDILIDKLEYRHDFVLMNETFEPFETVQCRSIPDALRFDCHPEDSASEISCMKRGCCWVPPISIGQNDAKGVPLNIPYCYYPKNWTIYKYENFTKDDNNFSGFLKLIGHSYYKKDLPLVKVQATSIDDSILRIKMYDPLMKRYEPPWPIRSDPQPFIKSDIMAKYIFESDSENTGFKVNRASDGTTLFNTIDSEGFIFSDQFLQISAILPTHNIYGIGEHMTRLKLNTTWQIFTLFNRDQPPIDDANLYGSHPFYLIIEESGKSHGVLFLNSNAMDIILQPLPAITFRTIGGIFDIYFFLGPTPADVVRQYSQIVGKPFFPPYWSLGFHLCRFGYKTLEETKEVWNRTRTAGIPFDTQWNDLDYMDRNNDFTYDKKKFKDLPQFINDLHSMGMHYIPLIDAGISASEDKGTYLPYDEGVKQDIFVKDSATNGPFIGKVWNYNSTVWPDYTNPKTPNYYLNMLKNMHDSFAYDGAWIDMNEPSNFYDGHRNGCSKNNLDYPVYVPKILGGVLATKTLCMNAKHYLGTHYDLHNTYGTSQAVVTNRALSAIRKKRPFIISRSTWVGHGHYAGHWTGDVYSSWHDLRMSIPAILSSNFYQMPMIGADICGFNGNATSALCNRWMQLGAFYPFSRNHNSDDTTEQDPVAMGDLVVQSSRRALTIRYWLLPYLYTLFFRAHRFGETVIRPLFFEFPNDPATYDIDTQFLWGRSLLINPVVEDKKLTVTSYIPRGLWYDLYTTKSFFATGRYYTLPAPLDTIPLMIRGGSILPAQKPGATTTESRKNNLELIVTLDEMGKAKGELYWDDGDSLDSIEKGKFLWSFFFAGRNTLFSVNTQKNSFDQAVILGSIQILGVMSDVSQVFLNANEIEFKYHSERNCLDISGLKLDLRTKFTLIWKYAKPMSI